METSFLLYPCLDLPSISLLVSNRRNIRWNLLQLEWRERIARLILAQSRRPRSLLLPWRWNTPNPRPCRAASCLSLSSRGTETLTLTHPFKPLPNRPAEKLLRQWEVTEKWVKMAGENPFFVTVHLPWVVCRSSLTTCTEGTVIRDRAQSLLARGSGQVERSLQPTALRMVSALLLRRPNSRPKWSNVR